MSHMEFVRRVHRKERMPSSLGDPWSNNQQQNEHHHNNNKQPIYIVVWLTNVVFYYYILLLCILLYILVEEIYSIISLSISSSSSPFFTIVVVVVIIIIIIIRHQTVAWMHAACMHGLISLHWTYLELLKDTQKSTYTFCQVHLTHHGRESPAPSC